MKRITYLFYLLALGIAGCSSADVIQPDKQLNIDIAAIDKYIMDNAIPDVVADASGVRYRILTEGTGTKPELYHYIRVKYTGSLMSDGTVFDQSPETDPAYATFLLSSVIRGWQIGMKLLPEGTTAVLYIPSTLAYGKFGTAGIPGNSNLIFDVELLDVIE